MDRTCYEFLRTQQLKPLLADLRLFPRFPFGPICAGAIPGRRAQGGRFLCRAWHRANHHRMEQILCRLDRRRRGEFRRLSRWVGGDARVRLAFREERDRCVLPRSHFAAAAARHDRTDPGEAGHQTDDRRHVCRRDQGLRGLSLCGRGHEFPAHQERRDLCLPERAATDRGRRQLSAHPDEARGHQDRRGGVLSGPQGRLSQQFLADQAFDLIHIKQHSLLCPIVFAASDPADAGETVPGGVRPC